MCVCCVLLQVALLVYMAHIGSFVPARSAVIGLTDRILTRLPGMESVVQHTSSFMADLAQVCWDSCGCWIARHRFCKASAQGKRERKLRRCKVLAAAWMHVGTV